MHAGLRILQHPRCSILVSQSSTAASKNKANACGLDTIGVLIKEPQTMGREISRGGGLGHWHSDTIPFSFAALCFLGPLAFPLPLWRNLCACPCWVSKVTLQEISIYLHKQEAKKKGGVPFVIITAQQRCGFPPHIKSILYGFLPRDYG